MRGDATQFDVQFMHRLMAAEGAPERASYLLHLLGGFMDKLQSKVAYAGGLPFVQVPARFLAFGAEDGVAASYIGQHGMQASAGIA